MVFLSFLHPTNSNLENRISFISNNVLVNDTTIAANTTGTYTATQDCAIIAFLASKGGYASTITLNGIIIASCNNFDSTNFVTIGQTIYLKKGQTVSLKASKELSLTYKVLAL